MRVFQTIRNIMPPTLFIVADGPRNETEAEYCKEVRKIVEQIDWPCRVLRNYSESNLGCKKRVSSGLDWVFTHADKAIILEDDCLPNNSFFFFCQEMLEKYKNHKEIMHIGGVNMQEKGERKETDMNILKSYYFSRIAQIWGWATWSRAWKKYDVSMADWPRVKDEKRLSTILKKPVFIDYFEYLFQRMYNGELTTWDVAWTYTCMKENGFAIIPQENLIENIGFGKGATHSKTHKGNFGNMKTKEMTFPLIHPDKIHIDENADNIIYKKVFGIQQRIGQRVLWFVKSNSPYSYKLLKTIFSSIKRLFHGINRG